MKKSVNNLNNSKKWLKQELESLRKKMLFYMRK